MLNAAQSVDKAPVTPVLNRKKRKISIDGSAGGFASPLPNLTATPIMPSRTPSPYFLRTRSVVQSPTTADELFKKARLLDSGFNKAVELYRKAAQAGNPEAMARLGELHLSGEGVKKDIKAAYNYFENSARLGCPEGMYGLANYLFNNGSDYFESREDNLVEVVNLYYKAARKSHLPSIYKYGYCGLYGVGVDKNVDEAFSWILKAANLRHPEAVFELANCYYNGWGVTQDVNEAIRLYTVAGELGCSEAYIPLGRFYDAKNDVARAVQNFTKALEQGNEGARLMLQNMKVNRNLQNKDIDNLASTALQTSISSTITSPVIAISPVLRLVDVNTVDQTTSRSATL